MNKSSIFGKTNESFRQEWVRGVLANIPAGSRILDAGAGELRNKEFCSHLIYVSQDICQYEGTGDGVGLQTGRWITDKIDIVSDITLIPVDVNSFDVVICTEVLEHVPDPVKAIKELSRIVKHDGFLVITVPFCSLTHFAPQHYSTGLSKYWFIYHLESLGFHDIKIISNGGWFDYIAQEIWRLPWCGKKYSNYAMGWVGLIFALPLLSVLFVLKKCDRQSCELLTFGLQVKAKKR